MRPVPEGVNLEELASRWWMYPMKPLHITEPVFRNLRLEEYWMERKFDGWRAIAITGGTTQLWTRQKRKLRTPDNLVTALAKLNLPKGTVLDGEIWTPDKRGGWEQNPGMKCLLTLWDCVRIGTKDLSKEPVEVRRRALQELVEERQDCISVVEALDASVENLHMIQDEAAKVRFQKDFRSGFIHGVVLKRRGSVRRDHPRRSAEHPDWLKIVFEGMSGWEPQA